MGEDTDAHGTSIFGPSTPDTTGRPELDRARSFWRAFTFGGIALGLSVATVVAAWADDWRWVITGMMVALLAFLGGGFGNATVTARAQLLDDDDDRQARAAGLTDEQGRPTRRDTP